MTGPFAMFGDDDAAVCADDACFITGPTLNADMAGSTSDAGTDLIEIEMAGAEAPRT